MPGAIFHARPAREPDPSNRHPYDAGGEPLCSGCGDEPVEDGEILGARCLLNHDPNDDADDAFERRREEEE